MDGPSTMMKSTMTVVGNCWCCNYYAFPSVFLNYLRADLINKSGRFFAFQLKPQLIIQLLLAAEAFSRWIIKIYLFVCCLFFTLVNNKISSYICNQPKDNKASFSVNIEFKSNTWTQLTRTTARVHAQQSQKYVESHDNSHPPSPPPSSEKSFDAATRLIDECYAARVCR